MRELTNHKVNECNEGLKIEVCDEPGAGGASHLYMITNFDTSTNDSDPFMQRYGQPATHTTILFQNGPILEKGVNGITQEALLAIVADRLEGFQSGEYACLDNAIALSHVQAAMERLQKRTRERQARGVEGTHEK